VLASGAVDPLARLGQALAEAGYAFVTPTPETHRRVLARGGEARTLRDVFGWSRPFAAAPCRSACSTCCKRRGRSKRGAAAAEQGALLVSGSAPARHSAYPTTAADAVFLGPDTYRFASFVQSRAPPRIGALADVGCGTGAGGLLLASRAGSVQLLDVNRSALRFARANCELNGIHAVVEESDVLSGAAGALDLIIANPPYLADPLRRAYRDGGGDLGTGLSLRIAREALERLRPGGRLLLYTGTAVVEGEDLLRQRLAPLLQGVPHEYFELDPDVFGEELENPPYTAADRIAVVGLDAWRP